MLEYSQKTIKMLFAVILVLWIAVSIFRWSYRRADTDLSIKARENTELSIKAATSNIIIERGKRDSIEIHTSGIKGFRDASSGDAIILIAKERRFSKGIIRIELPDRLFRAVAAETATGDIEASSIKASDLKLSVVTGEITLTESSADKAGISSTTGEIEIRDLISDSIVIKATTGDIEIIGTESNDLSIKTVSGDIYAEPEKLSSFDISLTSGDIKLKLKEQPGTIGFRTVSGDITINDEPIARTNSITGSGTLTGNISTVSGDLSIDY